MTSTTKIDFSDVMYLPVQVFYTGVGISVGLGHQKEDVDVNLTIEQAKELRDSLSEVLKEIE